MQRGMSFSPGPNTGGMFRGVTMFMLLLLGLLGARGAAAAGAAGAAGAAAEAGGWGSVAQGSVLGLQRGTLLKNSAALTEEGEDEDETEGAAAVMSHSVLGLQRSMLVRRKAAMPTEDPVEEGPSSGVLGFQTWSLVQKESVTLVEDTEGGADALLAQRGRVQKVAFDAVEDADGGAFGAGAMQPAPRPTTAQQVGPQPTKDQQVQVRPTSDRQASMGGATPAAPVAMLGLQRGFLTQKKAVTLEEYKSGEVGTPPGKAVLLKQSAAAPEAEASTTLSALGLQRRTERD